MAQIGMKHQQLTAVKTVAGMYSVTVEQRIHYETRQFATFKRSHKHNFEHHVHRQGQYTSLTCVRIYNHRFLGAFVKLRKVTISFVLSVRPSHETTQLLLDGFS